ncbi:FecR family protein [Pseudozobellia thermophila]|nr:FecR domain-containing protein [Pseudozobellia thermophila]
MKYINYNIEDFITDEYFQKWVLDSDAMCDNFWQNWLNDYPERQGLVEEARRFVLLLNAQEETLPEQDFNAMWRNIIERRTDAAGYVAEKRKSNGKVFLRAAAVLVGLMATTLAVYFMGQSNTAVTETPAQITLELEDGTIKVLDEMSSDVVIRSEAGVVKQEKNVLKYEGGHSSDEVVKYNQLTVPYGKKFEVALSDGSHVYLNSGSKLKYPAHFIAGEPRNVYLDGEAYFSVEKDSERPFTVITDDMKTRVLGTEFNVSSYKNENNTSTVLVEGSVLVYNSQEEPTEATVRLEPGQRAVFENNEIAVGQVNVEKYIAWKEGKLFFVDDPFTLILKELERNFNIEIENRYKALGDKKFTGTFDEESLDQILRVCSEHTPFQYERQDDKIVIREVNNNSK